MGMPTSPPPDDNNDVSEIQHIMVCAYCETPRGTIIQNCINCGSPLFKQKRIINKKPVTHKSF